MLRELSPVRQVPGENFRRWFADQTLEIIVWYDQASSISGFQACYDLPDQPRALTWTLKRGFSHATIDNGEDKPTSNRTPMLAPSSDYDAAKLFQSFLASGTELPPKEKAFIES